MLATCFPHPALRMTGVAPPVPLLRSTTLTVFILASAFIVSSAWCTTTAAKTSGDLAIAQTALRILQSRCQSCHGAQKQEGGLRLDSRDALLTGGDRGPAISAANAAAQSLLLRSVDQSDPDLQMPPKQLLTPTEVSILR